MRKTNKFLTSAYLSTFHMSTHNQYGGSFASKRFDFGERCSLLSAFGNRNSNSWCKKEVISRMNGIWTSKYK